MLPLIWSRGAGNGGRPCHHASGGKGRAVVTSSGRTCHGGGGQGLRKSPLIERFAGSGIGAAARDGSGASFGPLGPKFDVPDTDKGSHEGYQFVGSHCPFSDIGFDDEGIPV